MSSYETNWKYHKNAKIKFNDNMLPHYRIARKLQVQCLLSDGESGVKVEPWLKIHFSKSQNTHSRNQLICCFLESQKLFHRAGSTSNLKPIYALKAPNVRIVVIRSRATSVHPKSQSGLNQRNYLSLRESLHWLESTSVWVGLHCVTRAPFLYFIRS